jgi:sugar lactone lactonase YvrE
MNRKLLPLFILLILALSTLACLPGGLLSGKEAAEPTLAPTSPLAAPTAAPKPTTPPEPAPASAVTLEGEQRSEQGGFAFQVVSGYTVEGDFGLVGMEAPDADPEIGPALMLQGGVTEGGTTSQQLFDDFAGDVEADVQISEPREITVGGVPALAADLSLTSGETQAAGRAVFAAVTPTQSFLMLGIAPGDRWDNELAPLFDAVLASVRFFEPGTSEAGASTGESKAGAGGEIRQWATSATASSEYGTSNWAASQATGAPDTSDCGDSVTAWAASNQDTVEWLELGYDVAVYPTQVNVIQSNTPDQVSSVDLLDTEGEYHNIYLGKPEGKVECPYTLSIPVGGADYMAIGIKITIDQSVIPAPWNEIDAVELVGYASAAEIPSAAPPPEPAGTPGAAQPALVWTQYTQYSTDHGLAYDHILAVAVSPDGVAWFGTDGYGLSLFDGQNWTTYTTRDGLADDTVKSLAVAPDGTMWIGTFGMGVSRFDGQNWTTYTDRDGLPPYNNILSLAVAPDGSVWAGASEGVSHFDGQKWTSYTTQDGLAQKTVNAIAVAPDGTVWAGTNGGVSRFDGQQWTTYTTGDGLIADKVQSIAVASDGSVWFGTTDGASHFDGQTWTSYPESDDGLAHKLVPSIVEDRDGVLWFGTGYGLSRFDGQSWTTQPYHEGAPLSITGLAFSPDGSLWVGTPIGAYHYALAE